MTYTVKLSADAADELVASVLSEDFTNLKKDLKKVRKDKKGFVFSMDYEEDSIEIKKLITSYKQVLEYYGVK